MSAAPTVRPPRASTDAMLFGACVVCLAACAWWAMSASRDSMRTGEQGHVEPMINAGNEDRTPANTLVALNLAAFRTPIWVAPPLPPVPAVPPPQAKPEPPPPPPPPLKWQLLAIVRAPEDAALRAMIYDPESDAVIELAAGDAHSSATISAVHADRVIIQRGRHTHTLLLDPRIAATPSPAEGVP
ncbi:MAG: hypothetical protein KF869_15620 [Phycisphaeraceae bacterium]|nr:hypothetical protein [Phycisphaeraceae bacterium]